MRLFALLLVFTASAAFAQVANYQLSELDDSKLPSGVSVAVSPKNNKNIVAYAAGKVMYSNDAAVTWKQSQANFPEAGAAMPSIAADSKGNFLMVYTTPAYSDIYSSYSTDDGKTWSIPLAISLTTDKSNYNPHITAHPKKEEVVVTWTQSDKLGINAAECKSNVMMSISGNGGKKWAKPLQLNQDSGDCLDDDLTVRGATSCIALDGKIFIMWSSQGAMFYDRSYDGEMWISTDLAIVEQVGGWNIDMPGFGKIANMPTFTIDNSPSRIHGTLFMVYTDLKIGAGDADVWLMRSVNRGDNWTIAARINQDEPGRHQFLPRITIDPANGNVYIIYYDRRNYTDNQTDVYLAWSVDGGNQFKEKKINDKPFNPGLNSTNALVDYIGISAQRGLIIPVWTAINGTKQEVWTTVLKEFELNPPPPKESK